MNPTISCKLKLWINEDIEISVDLASYNHNLTKVVSCTPLISW